ncbi:MAG TPA: Fe-S cluster assembly protein SufD [Rhizomicrobium sp.]
MSSAAALPEVRREQAAALFRARGIPTRRVEAWKYSDLKTALGETGPDQMNEVSAAWSLAALPPGVESFDLSQGHIPDWALPHTGNNAMGAASLAFARSGVALRVSGAVTEPLRLNLAQSGHLRAVLVLEDGASATLIENAEAAAWRNAGFDIVLGENARLDHVRLSPRAPDAVLVEEFFVLVGSNAQYHAHFTDFGARLSRTELQIALQGEGALAELSGVSVLGDGAHADVTTHVTHAVPNTQSTQLFKYVANGKSRGVYQGKVTVAHGADGSDSRQTAKGLVLGERAEIDLKPELEILADDVKCAHGAAVGDLDAESLFYLRTRGIPESQARAMLMRAFLGDAIDKVEAEDVRATVRQAVEKALEGLA